MKKKHLKKIAKRQLKSRPALYRKFVAIDAMTRLIQAEKAVKRQRNSVFNTADLKEGYIKAFNKNIDQKSVIFKDTVDIYNNQFLQRVLTQLETVGVTTDHFMDASVEMREAMGIFVPLMKSIFNKAGQETLDGVANGFAQKASEHFYTAEDIIRALELRAEFFIGSMLNTDYDEKKEIITQGLNDGLGVDQIGRNLRTYFDDMSVSRARTIARTETGRLISSATNEAYKQSAVVTGKEWLTTRDAKVRNVMGTVNDHVKNDGQIVDTNGTFPNGEQYPGQLTINCRCALAPAV
jgi:SPP1 gp7 family putative phage head morphogenesis protein